MIDSIIKFSIGNKLVIMLFIFMLSVWGIYSITQIPIDAVPDITNNQVQVITRSTSLAAPEIEQYITAPIELSLANLPKVVEIRSISWFGLSVITVVFQENADLLQCRQLVSEQLKKAEADIPAGMGLPELGPITTGLGEIYQYALRAKKGYEAKYSNSDLRTLQDWVVRRQLTGTPGVIEVNSWGGKLKQYEVAIDPKQLLAMNITLQQVYTAIDANNGNMGGAYIEKAPNMYFVRTEGMVKTLDDIRNIPVALSKGIPITIKDVAIVRFGYATRYGAMTMNGKGEVVGGIVMMLKGSNSASVVAAVKKKMESIAKTLPKGVEIVPFLDRTKLVNTAIGTVTRNLIEGGLIVIFVLIILLGNLRAGLVVASVIPLSLLFAFGMMNTFGLSANLMSLGAIDFGLVVDGAVIIVESIFHHLVITHKHKEASISQREMDDTVFESASRIRKSASFAEIIILIVYLPILTLVGIEGKMFRPMALTVGFAIIGALILSLTYVPMASALFLSKKITGKKSFADRVIEKATRLYIPILKWSIRNPIILLSGSIGALVGSLLLFTTLGTEFIPTLDEGDFAIETRIQPGATLEESIKASTASEKILQKFPEVLDVVSKIGTSEVPTDPMPFNAMDVMVRLKDKSEWKTASNMADLADTMQRALSKLPGINYEFQQPIQMRFNELMTGVKSDIAVKIFGDNLSLLESNAITAGKIIAKVNGVASVKLEQVSGVPQMVVKYKRDKLAQYGLSIKDINNYVNTAFGGRFSGVVFENERRYDLVVRYDSTTRSALNAVQELFIDLPGHNMQIPLKEVADVRLENVTSQISRDNTHRRVVIGVNVKSKDIEGTVNAIDAALKQHLKLPTGYYFEYGGQFENLQQARTRLLIAVPAALFLILILLYLTFNSVKLALMIFSAIPFSIVGGVLALAIRGMPFSISAGVGFIALFGVAVLNGIVMIGYLKQLEKEGERNILHRVLHGTTVRLRPVLMTAAVASLGFIPMAFSSGNGAEVQKPLATVVIGGLLSAAALTLLVLPVLYLLFNRVKKTSTNNNVLNKVTAMVITLFLILPLAKNLNAQPISRSANANSNMKVLTLAEAESQALSNNQGLKSSGYSVSRERDLIKAQLDPGKTIVDLQYGQTQAPNADYTFSVIQGFAWPGLYSARTNQQKSRLNQFSLQQKVLSQDVLRQLRLVYYQLLFERNLQQLLNRQDTVFRQALKAATVRYKTGDVIKLDQLSAQVRLAELQNRMQLSNAEMQAYRADLKRLTNMADTVPDIDYTTPLVRLYTKTAAAEIENIPQLQLAKAAIPHAKFGLQAEKRTLAPDFRIGYINQSIVQVKNLQVGMVGVSIPTFGRPYSARINAAKKDLMLADASYGNTQQIVNANIKALNTRIEALQAGLTYYQNFALPQARAIIKTALLTYTSGEIDFTEYATATLQAWQIEENYLLNASKYNTEVITLQAYTEGL